MILAFLVYHLIDRKKVRNSNSTRTTMSTTSGHSKSMNTSDNDSMHRYLGFESLSLYELPLKIPFQDCEDAAGKVDDSSRDYDGGCPREVSRRQGGSVD